jgi:hypothetical protein
METSEQPITETNSEVPAPPVNPSSSTPPPSDPAAAPLPAADSAGDTASPAPPIDASGKEVEPTVTYQSVADWHGKELIDCDGATIGKLERVYFDVETDEPQFGTVKEGFMGRHLTFVPLIGATIGPDTLRVSVSRNRVKDAPTIQQDGDTLSPADESALYHHFELNYTPTDTTTGQRLALR